jgi:hypothetical protein
MISKQFISENKKDIIEVSYYEKSHKVYFTISLFNTKESNISLIEDVMYYLKEVNIQWVCVTFDHKFEPVIPENATTFEQKKNSDKCTKKICCHIEDFEKFYYVNFEKIVEYCTDNINKMKNRKHKLKHVVNDDGWTTICR